MKAPNIISDIANNLIFRNNKTGLKYYHYLLFFLIFVGLRLILYSVYGSYMGDNVIDGKEYFYNGTSLSIVYQTPWVYSHWWERTPIYMLFMHITQGNMIIQILFCGLAGTLAYKVNKWFGIYYLLYPNYVFQSFNYSKEALLISLLLILIYYLKEKSFHLFVSTCLISLGFLAFSQNIYDFNYAHRFQPMQAVWEIWKPTIDLFFANSVGTMTAFAIGLPFYLVIPYYFHKINRFDLSLILSLGITLFFSFGWACGRYREIALPFIVLYITRNLNMEWLHFRNYSRFKHSLAVKTGMSEYSPKEARNLFRWILSKVF